MEFRRFRELVQLQFEAMSANATHLFVTDVDREVMWNTYLDSFPPGTNNIFRVRREHDCGCCKQFVRAFGNVVVIGQDNELISIWDFTTPDEAYGPVAAAMSAFVKAALVRDVFVTKQAAFGTLQNYEQNEDGSVRTWEHFRIDLPSQFVVRGAKSEGALMGAYRDAKNVFQRSLTEISKDAIETVLDLIAQNSLYKGEEWMGPLRAFLGLYNEYHALTAHQNNYCWRKSIEVGPALSKIKNHSVGVLLADITAGMDLNEAVRRYEAIVAPSNYKRPKAIFTKKMVEQAEATLADFGLLDSLGRRFATIDDITANNILFANRDSLKRMGGVFAELKQEVAVNPKQFDRTEEIPIDHFVGHTLPRITSLEVFLENRHASNLVSVIAPANKDAKTLFKWNNGFSWAYAGNITDSMKERVKAAGGNIEGILRFSIQWNDGDNNQNDFDAHGVEPNGNHIYYARRGGHNSYGNLDVDIINPGNKVAVENITWPLLERMQKGMYRFFVENFSHNGGRTGFTAEIEFDGQIYSFAYNKELRNKEQVEVARVCLSNEGFSLTETLPSTTSSRKVWGLDTNQFHPVATAMYSPNYWDAQSGLGHRHYFFILKGCVNDTEPNGFFNEFLKEDLMAHKRVFEALGSKMRVAPSNNQLSGLGFSSTKRNSLVCKVEGHVSRVMKVVF